MTKAIRTNKLEETHELAHEFYAWLIGNNVDKGRRREEAMVVALRGDLGAGKTAFTQGLARAMGVEENVTSPTFVLMKKYKGLGGKNLVHFDAYRLTGAEDLTPLRFEEYVKDLNNVVVIEWPEVVHEALPSRAYVVDFKFIDENTREITLPY